MRLWFKLSFLILTLVLLVIIVPEIAVQSGLFPMVPVLVYHAVIPTSLGPLPEDGYTMSQERFAEQMRYLWSHGYHAISLPQLKDYLLKRSPLPSKPVVITFDDGYENNYLYAFPILRQYGFKATINIIVGRIGSQAGKDSAILAFLNWDQLREMAQSGLVDVQSHTYNSHDPVAIDALGNPGYPLLGPVYLWGAARLETEDEYQKRVLQDLRLARATIEREIGRPCITFTYPYGRETPLLRRLVRQAGYTLALTSHRGLNYYPSDPMSIKRIPVMQRDDLCRFILKLRPAGYLFSRLREAR
ncbi:MAG: polysaccharide deacetylase family protein [Firmicutes bacterium]|nr:polysaccharide deacetylase family protein [Bacillota bacterium]